MIKIYYFCILLWLTACSGEDANEPVIPSEPDPVAVSFDEDFEIMENASSKEIILQFDRPAAVEGEILLEVSSENMEAFELSPTVTEGILQLDIQKGQSKVILSLLPTNNDLLEGTKKLQLEIKSLSDHFLLGIKKQLKIEILDDELVGKPKGYRTETGSWKMKENYEYDVQGRILKMNWETETPALRSGTQTYFYNTEGKLEHINYSQNHNEYFYWENGKITRSEEFEDGTKTSFKEYDYDTAGNVAGVAKYDLQDNGSYKLNLIFIYLYWEDGNIYKQLTYIPARENDEESLISTQTYEDYLDKPNLFPVMEIIPTISTQKNLPGSYRLEEDGSDLFYSFSYEYNEEGLPVKRTTSSEVTFYEYY